MSWASSAVIRDTRFLPLSGVAHRPHALMLILMAGCLLYYHLYNFIPLVKLSTWLAVPGRARGCAMSGNQISRPALLNPGTGSAARMCERSMQVEAEADDSLAERGLR